MKAIQSLARHTPIYLVFVAIVPALLVVWQQEKSLTIAIHEGVEGVALKELARDFSRDREVAVEVVELPYDQLYDAEMEQVGSTTPRYDVIMVDDPWLPALVGEKDATRLEKLVFSNECTKMGLLDDFARPTLTVSRHYEDDSPITCDSTFYALPFVGNVQLFVMRRDLEPKPATWREVLDITRGKPGAPGAGYVTRVGSGNPIVTDFMPIVWSLSPTTFRTSLQLDGAFASALAYLAELGKNPGAHRGSVSLDDFDLAIYLAQRQASMSIAWAAWVMAISQLPPPYKERLLDEIEAVEVPGGHHALGAWLLAIPARLEPEQTALAREFLLFATASAQIETAAEDGNPPPRRSALKSKKLEKYPFLALQIKELETAVPRPRTPHWRAIEKGMGDCLSALYESAITESEARERIALAINTIANKQPLDGFSCQDDEWFERRARQTQGKKLVSEE